MYHEGNRALQDAFGSRALADRLDEKLRRNQFNDDDAGIQKPKREGENQFTLACMTDGDGSKRTEYRFDEEVVISVELSLDAFTPDLELAMRLLDRYKNSVFTIHERLEEHYDPTTKVARLKIAVASVFIAPGKYSWMICINRPGVTYYDLQNDVLPFRVLETGSAFARYEGANYGSVFARYSVQKPTP